MPAPRLCLVLPHVLLGGGESAMMEIADGLRRELALEVCALDNAATGGGATVRVGRAACVRQGALELCALANAATGGAPTVREELAARFGQVPFIRQRWQLRPRLAAADVVLWYGAINAVPARRRALAAHGRP